MNEPKTCKECGQVIDEKGKGLLCHPCHKLYLRNYYQANKEHLKQYQKTKRKKERIPKPEKTPEQIEAKKELGRERARKQQAKIRAKKQAAKAWQIHRNRGSNTKALKDPESYCGNDFWIKDNCYFYDWGFMSWCDVSKLSIEYFSKQ